MHHCLYSVGMLNIFKNIMQIPFGDIFWNMWDTAGDKEGLCLTGIKWCVVPKLD